MNNAEIDALLDKKLIGGSAKMQQLRMLVKFAARCNSSIMITGPSGSGKEVIASAIHAVSERSSGPNVTVNCGALPEQLIESELFGHEKGSFTGAINQHVGLFEQASSGTIFLDEIGDMPVNMQVKLLRVLETRIVNRVGGAQNIPVDVRVIAATHRNLSASIQNKSFREDLFYRLCVVPIEVPALNERTEDIPALIEHFLEQQEVSIERPMFTAEALSALQNYNWPGNVRELRNVIERAAVFFAGKAVYAQDVATLVQSDIAQAVQHSEKEAEIAPNEMSPQPQYRPADQFDSIRTKEQRRSTPMFLNTAENVSDLNAHLQSEERRIILQALQRSHGVVSRAARAINIKRTTLIDKMRKHNIDKQMDQMGSATNFEVAF